MANTFGGIVIIGVGEGVGGKPILPLAGIALERGLAERVTNVVLGNVTPPVFPEVAVCPNDSQSKAVLVIRIPQSPESPHAIGSNTRVYLRTGNTSNPEKSATLDDIGWLQSRRGKAVALRDHILNEGVKRSNLAFGFVKRSLGMRVRSTGTNLMLRVVPQFPGQHFKTPPELAQLFRAIRVRDYYGTNPEFPLGSTNADLLQDGAAVRAKIDNEWGTRHYYTELSVFGQYFYRQTMGAKHEGQDLVRASEIFCRVDEFCASARKFYGEIGYQGYVQLLTSIYDAHTMPLGQWAEDGRALPLSRCPDESIGYETSFLVADWESESRRALVAALKTIGWGFNWDISEQLIDRYYAKERRR